MLSYAFMRERVINNNSLGSYSDPKADQYFKERSL